LLRSPPTPPGAAATQLTGGRIAKGLDADLVVLSADPAQKASAFLKVRYTIRGGEIIYADEMKS
jgi:imidazolonepropionase-like amidohydrolase